jgi:CRP/FNR family transcriptional regulator
MTTVVSLKTKATARTYFMSQPEARKFEVSCTSCNLREVCLPGGLCVEDLERMQNVVYVRRRVKRGESLFNAGDEFKAIHAIRSGFFKTSLSDGEGREQVTGFSMGGELLGLEAIGTGRHGGNAVALEDSEVCVMPFALIEAAAHDVPALQRHLHAVLSREIVRDHGVMLLLGSMRAEQRLAAFLTNLSKRFLRRGYSASDFHLRMTREDIGSYLGLKLETVSRLFSQFQKDGLIDVEQKHVRILDIAGIERRLAGAK